MFLKRLAAVFFVLLTLPGLALAQIPFTKVSPTVTLSVSAVSSNVAIGTSARISVLWVCNTGATDAYLQMGDSTIVADTTGTLMRSGRCGNISPDGKLYIASVTASSTTTLSITPGSGIMFTDGGGGGGGGSGTPGGSSGQIQYNNAGAFGGVTPAFAAGCAAAVSGSSPTLSLTYSTQLVNPAAITSSQQDSAGWCGQEIIGNAATAQTLTLQNLAASNYFRFINKGAGTWTLTAGAGAINSGCTSVATNQSVDIQRDSGGTNWNISCGAGSGASAANPTATGSDAAVNGSAATFLRSDGAPAIQKGTNAQFGLAEGDNTSISMTAGVVSTKAMTGDVTASAGSLATTLAAGSASNLNSGTLPAGRMPALTGDCTTAAGAVATTCNQAHPGYIAGNWYLPFGIGTLAAGVVMNANKIQCFYGVIPKLVTILTLGARITTTAAGGNIQFAIYQNSSGVPGALIDKTASISVASGTLISGNLGGNQQLGPGGTGGGRDTWWCSNVDASAGGVAVLTGISTASGLQGSYQGSATQGNVLGASLSVVAKTCTGAACQGGSSTFNTWPANLATSTFSDDTTTQMPVIEFQVVSSP